MQKIFRPYSRVTIHFQNADSECPENVCICVSVHMSFLECARWHFAVHSEEHPSDAPTGHMSFSKSVWPHSWFAPNMYSKMPYFFLYILQILSLFFPA